MNIQKLLRQELEERKSRNPNYTLRSFSNFLNIHPSTLSKVLNGKRELSKDLIYDIGIKLKLNNEQLNDFLGKHNKIIFPQLASEIFNAINSWEYDAFLCLLSISNGIIDFPTYSKSLSMPEEKVREIFNKLYEVKAIQYKDTKWYDSSGNNEAGIHSPSTEELVSYQKSILSKIYNNISPTNSSNRSNTSLVFPFNSEKQYKLEKLINEFKSKVYNEFKDEELDKLDSVRCLQINFNELAKPIKTDGINN